MEKRELDEIVENTKSHFNKDLNSDNVKPVDSQLPTDKNRNSKKVYIESYGCQMNFSDSEIVRSILSKSGYKNEHDISEADVILLNTCSIRDKAEQKIKQRLTVLSQQKKKNTELIIGVLGCMAERLKQSLLAEHQLVDLVVGPDAYRDLPNLLNKVELGHQEVINIILSKEETYEDIQPIALDSNKVTAFISITRGCDNMCTFCVVPFTRGRERSRNPQTIVEEAKNLFNKGVKEITLLGQNVDSYLWYGKVGLRKVFDDLTAEEKQNAVNFPQLLEKVAQVSPKLRVRFSTSHPKDITDELIKAILKHENICNYIHLPVQSGSNKVLDLMNRGYSSEWYKNRIDTIRRYIPDCGISTDIIAGFCTETEQDHQLTLEMMSYVKYDYSYKFKYSERPNTLAQRKLKDDVDEAIKSRRLQEIIELQNKHSQEKNKKEIGNIHEVLIEGVSKKSKNHFSGRNTFNKVLVFPKKHFKIGDYANIKVIDSTPATLIGEVI